MSMRSGISTPRILEEAQLAALVRLASREGRVHLGAGLARIGLGEALRIELPEGIRSPHSSTKLQEALDAIESEKPGDVVAMASLPFHAEAPAHLSLPELRVDVDRDEGTAVLTHIAETPAPEERFDHLLASLREVDPVAPLPAVRERRSDPIGDDYAASVARAVREMRERGIAKIVLARREIGECVASIDPAALAEAHVAREFAADSASRLYSHPTTQGRLVGVSPELIIATDGHSVRAHPLAGTVALTGSAGDADRLMWLSESPKDLVEHALVVRDIAARLESQCDLVDAPSRPSLVTLATVAHLGTWIEAKLRGQPSAQRALELLGSVHPTPAVAGVPRDEALSLISRYEALDRGSYAGAVGWIDAAGSSEWFLALRGVFLDEARYLAWAGAGIVSDSDPVAEREETATKLDAILIALRSPRVRPDAS